MSSAAGRRRPGTERVYLVWLEWPEKCFRVDAEALRYLAGVVPAGSEIIRARSESAFLRALPRATHVVTWHFRREWFAKAPRLALLATPAAGRELVAHGDDAPAGVRVHFGGYHGDIIAESVAGFILAWAHGFFATAGRLGRGESIWPRSWLGGGCRDVAQSKAVILGYGRIGKAIGAKLETLGVSVAGFGRGNFAALGEAVKDADWFIMALPGDTGTDNLLDARLIAKMPRRCVVVNIGRGNAIDEDALADALATGRIAGAYLDVFKNEPSILQIVEPRNGGDGELPRTGSGKTPDGRAQTPNARDQTRNAKGARAAGGREPLHSGRCPNLVAMPHSAAFSPTYLKRCFKELKDEGLL